MTTHNKPKNWPMASDRRKRSQPWLLGSLFALLGACSSSAAMELPVPVPATDLAALPRVGFAILKTGKRSVREGMLYEGGNFSKVVESVFSAFLIKHGEHFLLLDTGLGSNVEQQYQADMPWWRRLSFTYDEPVHPGRQQLEQSGVPPIDRIILSHAHWDHASGLSDFSEVDVWVSAPEMGMIREARSGAGSAWPSQVSSKSIRWRTLQFKNVAYEGFEQSLDLFDDGSVILVPMYGHTPGSVGLFLTAESGKRYFFVGDVVWNAGALAEGRPKFWLARSIVDHDQAATQRTVEQIRRAMQRDPKLLVVPAHDGKVQAKLGFFPSWVR